MSNTAPKTPEVIESVVVTDVPTLLTETVKAPGKVKTALRHPIQTIKRHSVVSTALVASAAGAAVALLLTKSDSEESGGIEDDSIEITSTDDSFTVTSI